MNNPDEIDIDIDDENDNDVEIEEGTTTIYLQVASKLNCLIYKYIQAHYLCFSQRRLN